MSSDWIWAVNDKYNTYAVTQLEGCQQAHPYE